MFISIAFAVLISFGCGAKTASKIRPLAPKSELPVSSTTKERGNENSPELQALIDQEKDEAANKPEPPTGATAECLDDTYSFEHDRKRACEGHRGIKKWLNKSTGH